MFRVVLNAHATGALRAALEGKGEAGGVFEKDIARFFYPKLDWRSAGGRANLEARRLAETIDLLERTLD